MRFAPVACALSVVLALTASGGRSAPPEPLSPRAASLEAQGRSLLAAGETDGAIDAFEAALALQPGAAQLVMDLAEVARRQSLQGKALHYYRQVLARDPENLFAIAGEGAALAEKGATEKARRDLARLESMCGANCPATRQLASVIDRQAAQAATPAKTLADKGADAAPASAPDTAAPVKQ